MSALSEKKSIAMQGAIRKLFFQMAAHLQYEVSHNDFIELLVPEDLRAFATTGPEHFNLPYRNTTVQEEIKIQDAQCIYYRTANDRNGKTAPLVPRKPLTINHDDTRFAPIKSYLQEYLNLHFRFSLAAHTLRHLNDQCSSEQQIRFFWPSMLLLMEHSGDQLIAKAADKLRNSKTPKTAPSLPEWLRAACRETATTLTAATLMPEKAEPTREVTIGVRDVRGYTYMGQHFPSI